jgi:hypothetical protein
MLVGKRYATRMRTLLISLCLFGCSAVTPVVNSPCPGLWCFSVEQIPGPEFCYATQAAMQAGEAQYASNGFTVKELQ